MTFIERSRQYIHADSIGNQVRDILKIYDEGELDHSDCVLRIATVFSDQCNRRNNDQSTTA